MTVTYNGADIIPASLTLNVNSSLPVNNIIGGVQEYTPYTADAIAWFDPETNTVKTGEKKGEASITIRDAGEELTFTVKVVVEEASDNIPKSAEWVRDITISAGTNWQSETVRNLPRTDGKGNTYRYFIKEEKTGSFIPVAYSTSEGGAELSDALTLLDLTNNVTEDVSVTLPESGGRGTKPYYIFGGLLLIMSITGYAAYKRRRWSDE